MDASNWIAIAAVLVSLATIGFTWGQVRIARQALADAMRANVLAQESNRLAEKANHAAEAAVAQSRVANNIAREANAKAEEANAISRRSVEVAADAVEHDWKLEREERGRFTIVHDCAEAAQDVAITVRIDGAHYELGPYDRVAPFGVIELDTLPFFDAFFERVAASPLTARSVVGNIETDFRGETFTLTIEVGISYSTKSGKKFSTVLRDAVSYRNRPSGPQRVKRTHGTSK
ncbi:hypothetical protein JT358_11695 [Micrococcales bacterium 31B]|nr:hypothetical protein [Micrococcales bacterium 31B]